MAPRVTRAVSASLRSASPMPYWFDDPRHPPVLPGLTHLDSGPDSADLVVVGGGYLGLWTALLAKERDPSRDVLLLEAATCGHAASGRNGGFCEASLTHGFGNGLARWPRETDVLTAMGRENLDGIERTIEQHGIDCDFVRAGSLAVATQPHQVQGLREEYDETRAHGMGTTWLDADQVRERVDSPTFLAGVHDPDAAILEPARLAWGLRAACLSLGVRIAEQTPVTGLSRVGGAVAVQTGAGSVGARQVVLATNAYPSLLRRLRLMTVPVYDYALMTEPLTVEQRDAVGWRGREGVSDAGNQFHYFRTTRDGRILWGGYDAIYHFGSCLDDEYEQRAETHEVLARNFFATFPQLEGLSFSHTWGGVIDTCTRFTAFYGTAMGGRVGYALGFTGLGVAATRFAGDV
ncbi:MAG: FAD-dependent oxidoreductase, partial [Nocardioides sp.]|nr:FAD-dependent oxidoreductase [Nocardioides sp.]